MVPSYLFPAPISTAWTEQASALAAGFAGAKTACAGKGRQRPSRTRASRREQNSVNLPPPAFGAAAVRVSFPQAAAAAVRLLARDALARAACWYCRWPCDPRVRRCCFVTFVNFVVQFWQLIFLPQNLLARFFRHPPTSPPSRSFSSVKQKVAFSGWNSPQCVKSSDKMGNLAGKDRILSHIGKPGELESTMRPARSRREGRAPRSSCE